MEFTDPKVAGQLLEDLEEKEEQLALAAEFSAGLLARTEELAVENEAIQSEAEAAKALAAESQAALEASRLELLAKEAEMEERLREIAEATAEAMAEQLELSEGVPPRTDRSALLTGEGEVLSVNDGLAVVRGGGGDGKPARVKHFPVDALCRVLARS